MTTLTFTSYQVEDSGFVLTFYDANPGPGNENYKNILITDAELASVTSQAELQTLVLLKLRRKLLAAGIASKLDPFIGQIVTI